MRDVIDLGRNMVTAAGAYHTPIDHYHSQAIAPGESISSGGLRTIRNQSPKHYWYFSDINPNGEKRPETDAFAIGRAAHSLLLDDDFDEAFVVLPEKAPSRPTATQLRAASEGRPSENYKERASFWDAFDKRAEGKTIVKAEWLAIIEKMAKALHEHPAVSPLFDGQPEISLVWQDKITGVWLKARPDMLPSMGGVKADLKTTTDASLRALTRDITKHGYDMQAALSDAGMFEVYGETNLQDVLVFVEKTPPFDVTLIEIEEDAKHHAWLKVRKAIDTFARCLESGDWPGQVEGIPRYHTPDWQLHEIGEAQQAGEFPTKHFTEEAADE